MLPFGIQYVNTNAHAQYVPRRQQHPNCILGLERSTTRHLITQTLLITCAGISDETSGVDDGETTTDVPRGRPNLRPVVSCCQW